MKENYLSTAEFRFYEELNDFLQKEHKGRAFVHLFFGTPTVKEVIEGLGVPHTEIDLILINGVSVTFDCHLKQDDKVSVYPRFESLDISSVTRLRPIPLREVRFMTDVHLGTLTRYLRMLGFDTFYGQHLSDQDMIAKAIVEERILLTRDIGILKNSQVTHGYFLRNTAPQKQLKELIHRFDLKGKMAPFTRCLVCNERLISVKKDEIEKSLLEDTKRYYQTFFQCPNCKRIYWEGSHHAHMQKILQTLNQ